MKTPFFFVLLILAHHALFAQQSTLKLASYYSSQLHHNVNYYILLPPGYDGSTERYPVVYMLRGAEWEWITPTQDVFRGGRDLRTNVDALYMQGKIGKMIFVMPGLSQPATDAESYALAYETFPYIDSVYRTIPTRWHRGVDGFSYGGLDEMNVVSVRPDAFAAAGSYDGSFFQFDFNKVLGASPEQAHALAGIRFMHHSGADPAATNYSWVKLLVDSMAAHGWGNEFAEIRLAPNAIHNWWFADEHSLVTLPLHWETFSHAPQSIHATLLTPESGTRIAGTLDVTWSIADAPSSSREFLEYSPDRGKTWKELFSGPANIHSFSWNTASAPDGAWYLLRLSVVTDTAFGQAQVSAPFTIDNPGNGAPSVEFLSPGAGDSIAGLTHLLWAASDPEGDSLTFSLSVSADEGLTWEPIASELRGTDQYVWDSRLSPNCTSAILRIQCSDGSAVTNAWREGLKIHNDRITVSASSLLHVAGTGDGRVIPVVVDPSHVLQHNYQISFKDSAGKATRVSVYDLTRGSPVVSDVAMLGSGNEGTEFDGLRLEITQPDQPTYSPDSSGWISGVSTLTPHVSIPEFAVADSTIRGIRYPADYLITLYDHIVDTSSSLFEAIPAPLKFTVRNMTENRKVAVVFGDQDGDGQIGASDEVVIVEKGAAAVSIIAWDLSFAPVGTPVLPKAGDAYFLRILKPLTSRDTILFVPTVTGIGRDDNSARGEGFSLYQNYPNPFNPSTTIKFELPKESVVKLSVFDVLGREVGVLVNERRDAGAHDVKLDAAGLASGVYFYRLTAGSHVQTRKLLLVK